MCGRNRIEKVLDCSLCLSVNFSVRTIYSVLSASPTSSALSSELLEKLTYGPYLPTKLTAQVKPTQKPSDVDIHSGPLYRLLLDLRNQIAQVSLISQCTLEY